MLKPEYDTGKFRAHTSDLPAAKKNNFLAPIVNPLTPHDRMLNNFTSSASDHSFSTTNMRWVPLSLVILLHIGLFYVLKNSLLPAVHQARAMPKEVTVSLITLNSPSAPAVQPQAVSKTVPVVKKSPPKIHKPVTKPVIHKTITPTPTPTPTPVKPVSTTPSEKAISVPQEASAPAEEEAIPAASAPAAPQSAPSAVAHKGEDTPVQPKTITSGIVYIREPHVEYPEQSKRLGEEGRVNTRVFVDESGHVAKVEIKKSSGYPRLDEAAKQAVAEALFKPYKENGKAIPVIVNIPFNLTLEEE